MAAPKRNRSHPDDPAFEKTREKIKSTQLVNALMDHAVGKNDMKPSQIRAAEILLNKTLPNLSATELTSPDKSMVPTININGANINPTTKD